MNYHNITHDDMLNGEGLRVVLWVAGCDHHCKNCQNPETWDKNSGIPFDDKAQAELFRELKKDYISGITFSGGDPLFPENVNTTLRLCHWVNIDFPKKSVWLYTGYSWEYIQKKYSWVNYFVDVLVDGEFKEELKDENYPWAGSTNQRVIDVQRSLKERKLVLWETK